MRHLRTGGCLSDCVDVSNRTPNYKGHRAAITVSVTTWLERYQSGECVQVWAEMEAQVTDIGGPAAGKEAGRVVRETTERAHRNVLRLLEELTAMGYRFQGAADPAEPDYPLELRIGQALRYVREHGGVAFHANPWLHPALAWVEEEEIELPARFREGRPGRATFRPPSARTKAFLDALEQRGGRPFPLAVRAWFQTVGSVDLTGTHPLLNRDGSGGALRITLEGADVWAVGGVGAEFVASIRRAFQWGGFPGWADRGDAPVRELEWLRSKLLPL